MGSSTRSRSSSITTSDPPLSGRGAGGEGDVFALTLSSAEAEVLALDAAAFAGALPDPAARARYERLTASVGAGVVPEDLIRPLETMLELIFEKGRPSNRALLQTIYAKTPRGRQQAAATLEVNQALQTLIGQNISQLRLSAGPASHTLVVETDRCRLTLELDSSGARVASLETG